MAKSSPTKSSNKPSEATPAEASTTATETDTTVQPKTDDVATSKRAATKQVKETPVAPRPKKTKTPAAKQGSMMPSEQKLEHLAAAIAAAGDADNLLLILEHVDAAGGPAEVIESIEAYRALKNAVEQSGS